MTTTTTPGGIHHFAIKVRNLIAAEQFYRDVLGLAVIRRWPSAAGGGDRSVWMDMGDGLGTFLALEALESLASETAAADAGGDHAGSGSDCVDEHTGPEHAGHHLLALRIRPDQRATWEAKLVAAGVTVSHRTAYTIYLSDPEGNRLGLSHHPEPAEQP